MTTCDEHDIDPDDEDNYCSTCAGTGEGPDDGASCGDCGGRGYYKASKDVDDYDPPDDFDDYIGPD